MWCYIEFEIDDDDSSELKGVFGPYSSSEEANEAISNQVDENEDFQEIDALDYQHVVGSCASLFATMIDDEPDKLFAVYRME